MQTDEVTEKIKITRQQFNSIMELYRDQDPFVYALMEPVISAVHSALLMNDTSEERLASIREALYVIDSINSNIDEHGLSKEIEYNTLWCYLHAIYDYLLLLNHEYPKEGVDEIQ
jgi:hypothetical protein